MTSIMTRTIVLAYDRGLVVFLHPSQKKVYRFMEPQNYKRKSSFISRKCYFSFFPYDQSEEILKTRRCNENEGWNWFEGKTI